MGCEDCFSIEGDLISIRAETWRKWGKVPNRSLGGKCWSRRNGQCEGPGSAACSLWLLTPEGLASALLSKVSMYLTSCKILPYSKNFKVTVCLSIVIFTWWLLCHPFMMSCKIAHLPATPHPAHTRLKNNFSKFRSHRSLLQNTWKAHTHTNPSTEQNKTKQEPSVILPLRVYLCTTAVGILPFSYENAVSLRVLDPAVPLSDGVFSGCRVIQPLSAHYFFVRAGISCWAVAYCCWLELSLQT